MKAAYINPFIESILAVFEGILNCPVHRGKPYIRSDCHSEYDLYILAGVSGSLEGTVVVGFSREVASQIASRRLGRAVDADSPEAVEAMCEFVQRLCQDENSMSPACAVVAQSYQIQSQKDSVPICVPFECEWGGFAIEIAAKPPRGFFSAEQAKTTLSSVVELTSEVFQAVDRHQVCIHEINDELTSTNVHTAQDVVLAIKSLLQANDEVQQQLTAAEEKLREQSELIEAFSAQAHTDALTGLANRREFDAAISQVGEQPPPQGPSTALMMMDIDEFKFVNDTYGHRAGDAVLRGVANVLHQCIAKADLAARYGGDEFAVIFRHAPAGAAERRANEVRQRIASASFDTDSACLQITASIGVAVLLPDEDLESFIQRADEALYASKRAGRNCAHSHDGLRSRLISG